MDLFTPVLGNDAQHPNFRSILREANSFHRDELNEWARGFSDRDGEFCKGVSTSLVKNKRPRGIALVAAG
jgi:hypothetical protein